MKTLLATILFFVLQISIFGQKHHTHTFTSITPYGKVVFISKITKVRGKCIFSKITFLPNKDSLQSLYVLNLYQKLSTGLLDSNILNLKPKKISTTSSSLNTRL